LERERTSVSGLRRREEGGSASGAYGLRLSASWELTRPHQYSLMPMDLRSWGQ
jgi:hypothetical protein